MRRKTSRLLDKSVLLIATVLLAANTYNVPSREVWETALNGRRYFLIIPLVIVGVFGALSPIETITSRSRGQRDVTIRRQILNSLGRLLDEGSKVSPPLGMSDLGVHIWRRRRTLKHPLSGVLVRVGTYRVGTNPINKAFSPTKGVGVAGLCWKHDEEVAVDVEALRDRLSNEGEFNRYAEDNGPDSVMNFSWEQFNRLRHRGAVFATPIRNGRNKFVGCISVDASHGFDVLNGKELRDQSSLLAVVIGQAGFESV